jgi:hypothetical protein
VLCALGCRWTNAELQLAMGGPTASSHYQLQQQSHSFISHTPSCCSSSLLAASLGSSSSLVAADPGGSSTLARCPLRVLSAYSATASQEPLFTTCHDKFIGTVDYIWYTQPLEEQQGSGAGSELGGSQTAPNLGAAAARFALRPLSVLQPPSLQTLHTGMPCGAWPSDHVSLVADFALYDTAPQHAAAGSGRSAL